MIALGGRIQARRSAPLHVQFKLEKDSQDRLGDLDTVLIKGRVVRIFRGRTTVAVGNVVSFPLWVCRPGDEPTGPAFVHQDEYLRATYMEAYLSGVPPDCQLADYEFVILDVPSDEPAMSVEDLMVDVVKPNAGAEREKNWWQFWRRMRRRP